MTNGESLRRLSDLVTYPQEDLGTELKGWLDLNDELHRANLAKAMMALANHGGGYVLIGFAERDGQWVPDEPRPDDLGAYSVDACNGIVARYAEPQFHCEVHHPARNDSGLKFPVIKVPGGQRVPIRAKSDDPERRHVRQHDYYIRRPGPKSEAPLSGQEWDDLIRRCVQAGREELAEDFRRILHGSGGLSTPPGPAANELDLWEKESEERWMALVTEDRFPSIHQSPYAFGTWIVSYDVLGEFRQPSLGELVDILSRVSGHESGWPPWWYPTRADIAPYPYLGSIECWLIKAGSDPAYADFWRASPAGLMFLVRGHQEDSKENDRYDPGTIFDLTLPVWRAGEVLLHASRLSTALRGDNASDGEVQLRMRWTGLKERELVSWTQPLAHIVGGRVCHQSEVESQLTVAAADIPNQLPEIVAELTRPLYEAFDFFVPSMEMFQQQLTRMRSRGR